jgi:hypothetical protein
MTKRKPASVIHLYGGPFNEAYMAYVEQALEKRGGPEAMVRFLAGHLRRPQPSRLILDTVAAWLDGNDCFKLALVRRRSGKSWKRRVNDGAIAKALRQEIAAGEPKYGMMQRVGKRLGVSPAKVREVHKNLKAIRQRAIA